MPILNIQSSQAGLSGTLPSLAYIQTNDTVEQVTVSGYLNSAVQSGLASFSLPCLCEVSTVASPGAQPVADWYKLSYSAGNYLLVAAATRGGTAADKAASNNSLPDVASTAGSGFTLGHVITAADSAGTIQDAGYALGTAARKAVSDNSKDKVASVGGTGTVPAGNLAEFADTNGTVNDSGLASGDFGNAYTRNASDVSLANLASISAPVPIVSGNLTLFVDSVGSIGDSGIDPSSLATGTAGSKAASDNSLSTVASTAGSGFTNNNIILAADSAGTIKDSGLQIGNAATKYASNNSFPDLTSLADSFPTASGNLVKYADTFGSITNSGVNLQSANVAISAAEFLGMFATPKELIAAPGAGLMIVVHSMILDMTYGSVAYADGGSLNAQYGNLPNGAGPPVTAVPQSGADFFATADSLFLFTQVNAGLGFGAFPKANVANASVCLSNQTGAFTTGDSAFVARILYSVISV